jgi:hypothetical protein
VCTTQALITKSLMAPTKDIQIGHPSSDPASHCLHASVAR